jgi:AmmeMemoRadiSam system protein B
MGVAVALPKLRLDLEFLPSPVPERPGLLVRDPYRYSDSTLIVPPPLTRGLRLLDGAHTDVDLRDYLIEVAGRQDVSELAQHFLGALSEAGFLHDGTFQSMRQQRQDDFTRAERREAIHAGGGYPGEATALEATLRQWMAQPGRGLPSGFPRAAAPPQAGLESQNRLLGIAAPHVSPFAAPATYAAAYAALPADTAERTFVILGTSHYGAPGRFGLTRKPFRTPFGDAVTDTALVDRLASAAPDAFVVEDYCHAIEHSIEFQVLFLQSRFGAGVKIVPVLCGPLLGARPEDDRDVAAALDALGELQARDGKALAWVLGIDMAHMGRRYGDPWRARAHTGDMVAITAREAARLDRVGAGDADGFWNLVQGDGAARSGEDDLKWCGAAPLYTFLRAVPAARGTVLGYDHWNIDEESVVSFAALSFTGR